MLHRLRQMYFLVQDAAIALYARSIRKGPFVRERFPAADPLRDARHAAVYVHFDRNGVVHDYVLHQLRELVTAGFRVTFVSNSPVFPLASQERVASLCKEVLWRFNVGYDVGGYKDSITTIENLDRLESLVLMNDSVYGPFTHLTTVLGLADRSASDFWATTESFERRRHLQGFFLVFFPKAFLSKTFARFWKELPYVNHKWWIVRNVEVKLTHALEQSGLRGSVLAPYQPLALHAKRRMAETNNSGVPSEKSPDFERFRAMVMGNAPLNPMQYFWDTLIADFAGPFIKRDLLLNNPENIPFVERWREVIAAHSEYDTKLIDAHLDYLKSAREKR